MKYLFKIILLSVFVMTSCKKEDFTSSNIKSLDGNLESFLSLIHSELDGTILFEDYSYNFVGAEKYKIVGSFENTANILELNLDQNQILLNEEKSFHYDSSLPVGISNSPLTGISNVFGTSFDIDFKLSSGSIISKPFEVPQKLSFSFTEENPAIYPGKHLSWNANPKDQFGLYIIFEYDPAANIHIQEVVDGTAYQNKVIWYIHTEDDGSYTFTNSDFSTNIPSKGARIGFRAIRATLEDTNIGGNDLRFVAHSEVHGICEYASNN